MASTSELLIVRVGCRFEYEARVRCPAVFMIRPEGAATEASIRTERWESQPALEFHDFLDLYQNRCRRLTIPAGDFSVRYDAEVAVSPDPAPEDRMARQHLVDELPDDVLIYTVASRFCPSDEVADEAWQLFGSLPPGWPCVAAICDWVHANVQFHYGESSPCKTAVDVLRTKTGVCRDFAHLAIMFCRALSIPARYAFGYLPDIDVPPPGSPMDFCAWFEAYRGGRWWTFDPRNNQRRKCNIIVGRGRAALDVAMVTTYGAAQLTSMTVCADRVE